MAESTVQETGGKLQALNDAANNTISELMKRLKLCEEEKKNEIQMLESKVQSLEDQIVIIKSTTNVGTFGIAKGRTLSEISEMLTSSMQRMSYLEEENNELKSVCNENQREISEAKEELKREREKTCRPGLPATLATIGNDQEEQWLEIASAFKPVPAKSMVDDDIVYGGDANSYRSGSQQSSARSNRRSEVDVSISPISRTQVIPTRSNEEVHTVENTIANVDAYLERQKRRDVSFEERASRLHNISGSVDVDTDKIMAQETQGDPNPPTKSPIKVKASRYASDRDNNISPYAQPLHSTSKHVGGGNNKPPLAKKGKFLPNISRDHSQY